MAHVSSRARFKSLQQAFAYGNSKLLTCLAQMSVLYEDLRIETLGVTANATEVVRLDYLDERYRVHYFLRRSTVTLMEFRGALARIYKTDEFKTEKRATMSPRANETRLRNRDLFKMLDDALKFFEAKHHLLRNIRNAVGGHFTDDAAESATTSLHPEASGKLKITFDAEGRGGGPLLYYAGEIAATAFTKALPGLRSRQDEISEAIQTIRDGYAYATKAMHALIILFLWDRFA